MPRCEIGYNMVRGTHQIRLDGKIIGELSDDDLRSHVINHYNVGTEKDSLTPRAKDYRRSQGPDRLSGLAKSAYAQLKAEALILMERHNAAHPEKPMRFDEAFWEMAGKDYNRDLAVQLRQEMSVGYQGE
jgi:hypothetical protein